MVRVRQRNWTIEAGCEAGPLHLRTSASYSKDNKVIVLQDCAMMLDLACRVAVLC